MNHAHDRELIDLLRVRNFTLRKNEKIENNMFFTIFFENLQMTSDYLSKFTNDDGEKQTCNVEMRHLYKRIYFKPGLKGTIFTVKL